MPIDEAPRLAERERIIRESWVRSVEAQLVREKLDHCYETEGVNHMESCKDLRERYIDMLRENRVKGYKQIDL
ncbi:NADH-ubiquinone oxidoreductase 12 kDa subunit [Trametes cingulata]|nr:NADH-ubiquinone oxidoreductase 12 kDa subunit [Trametes cingulata]